MIQGYTAGHTGKGKQRIQRKQGHTGVSAVDTWVCRGIQWIQYKSIQRTQEIKWGTIGYNRIQGVQYDRRKEEICG